MIDNALRLLDKSILCGRTVSWGEWANTSILNMKLGHATDALTDPCMATVRESERFPRPSLFEPPLHRHSVSTERFRSNRHKASRRGASTILVVKTLFDLS